MPKTAVAISRHGSCHISKTAILGKLEGGRGREGEGGGGNLL